jgi:hypothetical protein
MLFAVNLLKRYRKEAEKADRETFAASLVAAWRTAFKGGGRPDDLRNAQHLITHTLNVIRHPTGRSVSPSEPPTAAFQALTNALQANFPELLDDSQAGRFGFVPSKDGFTLKANVLASDAGDMYEMYPVELSVTCEPSTTAPLAVAFFLDRSFGDAPFLVVGQAGKNVIEMKTFAYGPFTVGAQVVGTGFTVGLELDLQTLEDAPLEFKEAAWR